MITILSYIILLASVLIGSLAVYFFLLKTNLI